MSNNNTFALILAGGIGQRMGNVEKPKQYLELKGRPIITYTIEKFVVCPDFEKIIILCPRPWIRHTEDLIRKYIPTPESTVVIAGGSTRNETIMNGIAYIEENFGLDEDTIIVTHDAVRPFVTHRIIQENIRFAREVGACDTVIPATDTIVESLDHKSISSIPDRSVMYQGQTPQSFRAKQLRDLYQSLTPEEKNILTDASKILALKGYTVQLVEGEVYNIKLTYPYDLRVADSILGGDFEC
ncbi:MAG: 2-C-methyl-D-erythritol 4-phosphate cytidylyltransferase [Lachnospiraceae bacterium]|nr:2-C-methyl-D-erythritol 4-phosphate cytidylyltransferase [Lachnospiraceae bacterium]